MSLIKNDDLIFSENSDFQFNVLKETFTAHLVKPDVIHSLPETKLEISIDKNATIELGNLINPENVDNRPIIHLSGFDNHKYYTLIMTDPDVPNRALPTEKEYVHWLMVNITQNSLTKGDVIVPYEPPLPKRGSGLHRYVFVLLEQTHCIVYDMNDLKKVEISNSYLIEEKAEATAKNPLKIFPKTPSQFPGVGFKPKIPNAEGDTQPNLTNNSPKQLLPSALKHSSAKSLLKTNTIEDFQRSGFSTKRFMSKYMIKCVAAANFFQTEYNDYVGKKLTQNQDIIKKSHLLTSALNNGPEQSLTKSTKRDGLTSAKGRATTGKSLESKFEKLNVSKK